MKKVIVAMMLMAMTATTVAGCGSNDTAADTTTETAAEDTTADTADAAEDTAADTATAGAASGAISVLSREDLVPEAHSSSCSELSRKMQMVIKQTTPSTAQRSPTVLL